jgi:hypothetical protein
VSAKLRTGVGKDEIEDEDGDEEGEADDEDFMEDEFGDDDDLEGLMDVIFLSRTLLPELVVAY